MFVKLTSGFERVMLISRNLILQGFLKSGSKSCKPEVTFAIHPYLRVGGGMLNLNSDVPTEMISIIQAVIILLITAESFLSSWKTKLTVSNALEVKD